jgi:hypothetical protein
MRFLLILFFSLSAAAVHAKPDRKQIEKHDVYALAMSGRNLRPAQVHELEAAIDKNPTDLSVRAKLLGYYFTSRITDETAKTEARKHVLWIIQNQPASELAGTPYCQLDAIIDPDGYSSAKQLWSDQIRAHKDDTAILGHAARFFFLHDRDRAADLLKQAQQAEPTNPEWPDQLGHLYALKSNKEFVKQALAEFEKAQTVDTSEISKFSRLDDLAKSAFAAGEIEKASNYAHESLKIAAERQKKNESYGNAVHHANNILGRIALEQHDVKLAGNYLLKAGQTPGSPQLDSFGPNMSLAKELLEVGEKDTVIEYFDECRKFWQLGAGKLDAWTKEVKAGEVPQFGANLVY